ncbi:MAG: hemerythrin family protein [Desulfofustis sp.]|nr:hemerythrin family protein [Desulfofustis sp.]
MAVIKWRDSFNTGVAQFDREHHQVVEMIDRLYQAIREKSDQGVVSQVCAELVAYAEYHFANEEKAMAAVSFPGLEEHRREHALLKEQAMAFQVRIAERFPEGVTEFYHFLREWLVNHIQECDRKYGPALANVSEQ